MIGIHGQAHGTPREAPFKACLLEDVGKALFLGLRTDKARTGNDHRADAVLDLLALQDRRRSPQILDPAIGAGSDEDRVDLKRDYQSRLDFGVDLIETDLPVQVGALLYDPPEIPASKARFFHPPTGTETSRLKGAKDE